MGSAAGRSCRHSSLAATCSIQLVHPDPVREQRERQHPRQAVGARQPARQPARWCQYGVGTVVPLEKRLEPDRVVQGQDRKSTTSELQSLMRISYAVFCLKKKINKETNDNRKRKSESND